MNKKLFIELEKKSGVLGTSASFLWKHPKLTLGLIGGGALGLGAINLANKINGAYVIQNEMRKRGLMKQQMDILQQIANDSKKESKDVRDIRNISINHIVKR